MNRDSIMGQSDNTGLVSFPLRIAWSGGASSVETPRWGVSFVLSTLSTISGRS